MLPLCYNQKQIITKIYNVKDYVMNKFKTTSELSFLGSIHYPEIAIHKNRFTFITGKSGCGKSSYLKILNACIESKENTVFFDGKPISSYDVLPYRKKVLLVPQNVYLTNGSVADNFRFFYENREQTPISEWEMKKFLKLCCIDVDVNTLCETMSGGERQRVFLAIFLSLATDTLLLDEPTAALDEKTADLLMKNLKDYCKSQQFTVVCICHSKKLVEQYADDVINMGGLSIE